MQNTAKGQYWLTCVHSYNLIKEYKEYAHGDPMSDDRRIVLDQTMMEELKDVLVFQPNDLLERKRNGRLCGAYQRVISYGLVSQALLDCLTQFFFPFRKPSIA